MCNLRVKVEPLPIIDSTDKVPLFMSVNCLHSNNPHPETRFVRPCHCAFSLNKSLIFC